MKNLEIFELKNIKMNKKIDFCKSKIYQHSWDAGYKADYKNAIGNYNERIDTP